jgi:hypothetical protein
MSENLYIDWDEILKNEDVESQWSIFRRKYIEALEDCVPQNKINTNRKRYKYPLDSKTRTKIKRKDRLWKQYMGTKDGKNI